MIRFRQHRGAPLRATSSLSLRWRVMLLAMAMVAMVVVLMAFAVYAVISAALYSDIDNQLESRAQLLITSGSLAADPGKAIEGTAYSDVNAMLVNPGHSIYTANQPGQTLPVGTAEKAVIRGDLFMSRRTAADRRGDDQTALGAADRRRDRCGDSRGGRGNGHPCRAASGGSTDRGGRTGGPDRRPASHPGVRQRSE